MSALVQFAGSEHRADHCRLMESLMVYPLTMTCQSHSEFIWR